MIERKTKKISTTFLEEPMSDYLVTISLQVGNLTKREIEHKVRNAFGVNLSKTPAIRIFRSLGATYEACASSGHFGCVHWSNADLESKFDELGIPMTPELLSRAKSSYLLRHIDDSMVEAGWKVIEHAIIEAQLVTDEGEGLTR